jgi:hypothetical protein
VMFFTRRIDWHDEDAGRTSGSPGAGGSVAGGAA